MNSGNIEKTCTAPVTAIIGMDMEFYEKLPKLFPHNPEARSWFADNQANIEATAMRSSSLQGCYFIMAARRRPGPRAYVRFQCGQDQCTFFSGASVKANFVCCVGYGDTSKLHPHGPHLAFEEACHIA